MDPGRLRLWMSEMVPRSPPVLAPGAVPPAQGYASPVRLDSGPSRSNIDAGSGKERHLQQALVQPSIDPRPPGLSWCAAFLLPPPCPYAHPQASQLPSSPAPQLPAPGEATRQAGRPSSFAMLESSWHHARKELEVEFESAVWRPTLSSHFPVSLLDGSTKLFIIEKSTPNGTLLSPLKPPGLPLDSRLPSCQTKSCLSAVAC
jgi:hypothetical protein